MYPGGVVPGATRIVVEAAPAPEPFIGRAFGISDGGRGPLAGPGAGLPAASNIGYFAAVDAPACVYGFVGTPGPGAYGVPPPGIGFRFPAASNIGTRVGFARFIGDAFGIRDGWFGTSGVLNWVAPPGTCGRAGTPGPGEYVWVIGVGFPAASNIGRGMDEGLPAASNIGTS